VSDITMPKMDGMALSGKVKHLYPKTIVIMATAYYKGRPKNVTG